jgi:phenylacetyl-CoA:acceptor oxidoreductase subunit 1
MERIDVGLSQGFIPGINPEATPNCVRFCIADALIFGDLNDPDSMVSKLISENKTVRLQEDLKTEAAVYYIVEGLTTLVDRKDFK